ncbi:LSU ribosomal protein L1p (L10Ae) [Olavius algarvensis spirochete endosymbiont]|uniref:50S ribosomal protein L1 n=1 Tax=Olavius algarvensis spirochete endosymbiont TaxID=260710 RepID=UPI00052E1CB9|nr:50S ribosomal protein L1 [Olavius algarvensis spirochete endosymbiont]KGM43074.1 50S ribosomal protein L1 [Alkalispirochaeta odontotermitis]VDB00913.1 LSU ribosomal protein L1p (L10Ae) [Olavius algarvensis spirochete endosymbiont]
MKHGKQYRKSFEKLDISKVYGIQEGVDIAKAMAFAKFDETLDVSVKLNVKKSHSVRETFVLPHRFAVEKRVLVFAKDEKAKEAEEAGASVVGAEDLVEKIKGGWLEFDVCVATPDMMRGVGTLGPILGRRGLMPNPKTRTVTMDIKETVGELKQGRIEFRADKGGVVHLPVGKVSMESSKVRDNIEAFISELSRKRPADVKGNFIKSINLSSTMGPGLKLKNKEEN